MGQLNRVRQVYSPISNLKTQELIVKKTEEQQKQVKLENEIKKKHKLPDNENPNHLEDFNELIKKASKPIKPPQT